MELREAVRTLGPERVRLGMRAIDNRRNREDGQLCASCFVGEAFGGLPGSYLQAHGMMPVSVRRGYPVLVSRCIRQAATVCERAFEFGGCAELRAECVALLAEHGTAVEPRMVPA